MLYIGQFGQAYFCFTDGKSQYMIVSGHVAIIVEVKQMDVKPKFSFLFNMITFI